jgi:ribose 5-phosphate isomerase B
MIRRAASAVREGAVRIALGSDHRGYPLKERLKELLTGEGHEIVDVGTDSVDSADYPEYGLAVAAKTASGEVDRGIVVCASGIGMSIAANKVDGVRAALCHTVEEARMSRRHNDANVLALSEKRLRDPALEDLVHTWLETEFEGGRHRRRLEKISRYEQGR